MRTLVLTLLVACGPSTSAPPPSSPTPVEPTPTEPTPTEPGSADAACDGAGTKQVLTTDECTCLGGRYNASIGGGSQDHCDPGESELAPVRFGLEGGWCCVSASD